MEKGDFNEITVEQKMEKTSIYWWFSGIYASNNTWVTWGRSSTPTITEALSTATKKQKKEQ